MTQRYSIADLRYAGGKAHETRYVSEVDYDLLVQKYAALQQRLTGTDERVGVLGDMLLALEGLTSEGFEPDYGSDKLGAVWVTAGEWKIIKAAIAKARGQV